MNPLLELLKCGQSYWLDNLTRGKLASGELHRRVTEQGLRGVTSNPAIFHKAIAGSRDYDAQIAQLVRQGCAIHEIYERLVVSDIQQACDVLRPVYDATDGADGFVSLEVSPYLAYDTEGTMQEVRRLWSAVDRPNLFIKIPGTPAGVPAIEQMLYEGININITLLFSIQAYEAVAHAYIRALERRVAEGKPVERIASVASFFLSRIDVLVDQLLGYRIQPASAGEQAPRAALLFGRVAIANAKLAYQSFKKIFSGERWQALEARGARVQRPLWASTSTKDPLYDDVRYVEPLIAPHTVNTMPDETIAAFADHGVVRENTVEADVADAQQVMRELQQVGIELDRVTWQLQHEGVQKFIEPFDKLMQTLAEKRQALLGDAVSRQTMALGSLKATVTAAFSALDGRQFTRRLWAHDPFLWTADVREAEAIRQRLGWLDSVERLRGGMADLAQFVAEVKSAQLTPVVLLSVGAGAICRDVCWEMLATTPGWPQLLVLDSTDPTAIGEVEAYLDTGRTLFLVASRSGTNAETLGLYRYFYERVSQRAAGSAGEHFVALSDAGTPLLEEARRRGFRRVFENPPAMVGPYLALSYFNLLPMALVGVDVAKLLDGAQQMRISCGPWVPAQANPGVSLGALLGVAARQGRATVVFALDEPLRPFGAWVARLLADGTAKAKPRLRPVVGEPLGSPDSYGHDRVFVAMRLAGREAAATELPLAALEEAGHPVVRIVLPDIIDIGAEFFRWEVATATAAAILGVNPFAEA
jgi:transaldolase/glucose-6-phosphate isomerase